MITFTGPADIVRAQFAALRPLLRCEVAPVAIHLNQAPWRSDRGAYRGSTGNKP